MEKFGPGGVSKVIYAELYWSENKLELFLMLQDCFDNCCA